MDDVLLDVEEKMEETIDRFNEELKKVRTGRANINILDNIRVSYYGEMLPLNQIGNLSTPDPRTIAIDPWDKSVIKEVEKSLLQSDLGLTPNNDGTLIRINIPALTEERRKEFSKMVKTREEEFKVTIRNIRRDGNEELKKKKKASEITEDDEKKGLDQIQKLHDKFIQQIEKHTESKIKEIMTV